MNSTLSDAPRPRQDSARFSAGLIAAITVFAALAPVMLLAGPLVAAQLTLQYHLQPAQVGLFFTIALGAMSLATLPAYWWMPRTDCRRAACVAVLIFIGANLATTWATSFALLAVLQFVAGLAGGSLMVLSMSLSGTAKNKDRVFAFWVIGQMVLGGAELYLLPSLFQAHGLSVMFLLLAIVTALASPLLLFFPARPVHAVTHERVARAARVRPGRLAMCSAASVLMFYVGVSGVWTFLGTVAHGGGITTDVLHRILVIAPVVGMIGAALTALIGQRFHRTAMIVIGFTLIICGIALLYGDPDVVRFATGTYAFKLAWTFVLPFMLASIGHIDSTGRVINTINLTIGGGLAIGPGIMGWVVQAGGGANAMVLASVAVLMVSLLLMLPVALAGARRVQMPRASQAMQ